MRQGHEFPAKWALGEVTPMELNRTLNPRPDMRQISGDTSKSLRIAARSSGASQSPMSGPAISTAHQMAFPQSVRWRRFQALSLRGFSGHGFGIGPGAGHMIADIITGTAPIVDPRPYRPERLKTGAWGKIAEF